MDVEWFLYGLFFLVVALHHLISGMASHLSAILLARVKAFSASPEAKVKGRFNAHFCLHPCVQVPGSDISVPLPAPIKDSMFVLLSLSAPHCCLAQHLMCII